MENVKRGIWGFVNDELVRKELFVVSILTHVLSFGVHSSPEVVFWLLNPGKVSNKHVAIRLHLLAALTQNFRKHFVIVDERGDSVRQNYAIDLLWKGKLVIKNV